MTDQKPDSRPDTRDDAYAIRLAKLQLARWKDVLGVQAPYRWNLRRLKPGFTLEIGCGLGRNLKHLDGDGIGVDHNPHMVQVARSRGFQAFTPDERETSFCQPKRFDCSVALSRARTHDRARGGVVIADLHSLLRAQEKSSSLRPRRRPLFGCHARSIHGRHCVPSPEAQAWQSSGILVSVSSTVRNAVQYNNSCRPAPSETKINRPPKDRMATATPDIAITPTFPGL